VFLGRSSLVALCISLALLHGCRHQAASFEDIRIAYEVSPQPPRVGPTTIILSLAEPSGRPITGARITLEGNMTHAGMAPVFAGAMEVEPGRYRATLQLSMAGDWVVVAHVNLATGRKLDHQFEINGVAL
jgi:hypothetical protein